MGVETERRFSLDLCQELSLASDELLKRLFLIEKTGQMPTINAIATILLPVANTASVYQRFLNDVVGSYSEQFAQPLEIAKDYLPMAKLGSEFRDDCCKELAMFSTLEPGWLEAEVETDGDEHDLTTAEARHIYYPLTLQHFFDNAIEICKFNYCSMAGAIRRVGMSSEIGLLTTALQGGDKRTEGATEATSQSVGGGLNQQSAISQLERETPHLDTESIDWIRAKEIVGEKSENLKRGALSKYRLESQGGIQTPDKMLGKDKDGRVWRRIGTPKSHPWYLRKTLHGKLRTLPKP